jgi:hypothetical protein
MEDFTTQIALRSICLIFGRFLFKIILITIEFFADWGWDHEVLQILVYFQILSRLKSIARK